jgi:hypothetical protein
METVSVKMPPSEARDLYRKYKQHLHHSERIDHECLRAYQLLAQGRLLIKALESIKAAGLNAEGLPRLAIAPMNATTCDCRVYASGAAVFDGRKEKGYRGGDDTREWLTQRAYFRFPRGSFAATREIWRATALVPGVPVHLRPARGQANYHILWEAEWTRIAPRDPYLLRRIGKGDLWVICAMWNLTEVERAALSTRL